MEDKSEPDFGNVQNWGALPILKTFVPIEHVTNPL